MPEIWYTRGFAYRAVPLWAEVRGVHSSRAVTSDAVIIIRACSIVIYFSMGVWENFGVEFGGGF